MAPRLLEYAVRFEIDVTVRAATREAADRAKDRLADRIQRAMRGAVPSLRRATVDAGPAEEMEDPPIPPPERMIRVEAVVTRIIERRMPVLPPVPREPAREGG